MYNFLKQLCEERGTNISSLCTAVTGNSGNLATWKKGYMRSDYLAKCADLLGVSADYILQRSSEADPEEELMISKIKQLNDQQKEMLESYIEFIQFQNKTKPAEKKRSTERFEEMHKEVSEIRDSLYKMRGSSDK